MSSAPTDCPQYAYSPALLAALERGAGWKRYWSLFTRALGVLMLLLAAAGIILALFVGLHRPGLGAPAGLLFLAGASLFIYAILAKGDPDAPVRRWELREDGSLKVEFPFPLRNRVWSPSDFGGLRRVEAAQKPAAVAAVMKEEGLACFEIIFYWGADSRTIMPGITLPLGSLNLAFDFFVPSAMAKAFEANWDGPTKKWDPPPESFGIRLRTPQGKN